VAFLKKIFEKELEKEKNENLLNEKNQIGEREKILLKRKREETKLSIDGNMIEVKNDNKYLDISNTIIPGIGTKYLIDHRTDEEILSIDDERIDKIQDMSVFEHKFAFLVFSQYSTLDTLKDANLYFRFRISDFIRLSFNLESNESIDSVYYKKFNALFSSISHAQVRYSHHTKDKKMSNVINLFSRITHIEYKNKPNESSVIEIVVNPEALNFLVQLENNFTKVKLSQIMKVKKIYELRILFLIAKYRNLGKIKLNINELNELLGSENLNYSVLCQKGLINAINKVSEIDESLGLSHIYDKKSQTITFLYSKNIKGEKRKLTTDEKLARKESCVRYYSEEEMLERKMKEEAERQERINSASPMDDDLEF
jgi:plasmid replication initiation protein